MVAQMFKPVGGAVREAGDVPFNANERAARRQRARLVGEVCSLADYWFSKSEPATQLKVPGALPELPPLTEDSTPLAVLSYPPLTEE